MSKNFVEKKQVFNSKNIFAYIFFLPLYLKFLINFFIMNDDPYPSCKKQVVITTL